MSFDRILQSDGEVEKSSNPVDDLLTYIDEHKQDLKDNVYKNLLEKLAPLNDRFVKRDKYLVKILETKPYIDISSGSQITKIVHKTHTREYEFTEEEFEKLDNELVEEHIDIDFLLFYSHNNEGIEKLYQDITLLSSSKSQKIITNSSCHTCNDINIIQQTLYNNVVISSVTKILQ
jgi:hypothetical protein